MNKIAAAVCASAAMIIAAPAFADTNEVDVGKITCGESCAQRFVNFLKMLLPILSKIVLIIIMFIASLL